MTQKTKENIVTIFDEAINKPQAMRAIADSFAISRDEIKDVLREFGREIPYERKKTKQETAEAAAGDPVKVPEEEPQKAAGQERSLPIPQYIVEVLTKELDCLDGQIEAVQQQLDELNQRYTQIAEFLIHSKP